MPFLFYFIWLNSVEKQSEFETPKTCESEGKFSQPYLKSRLHQIFFVFFTTKSKQNIYNDKYFQIFEQNIGEIGKLIEQ